MSVRTLLVAGQLVAVALTYGIVGVEVREPQCRDEAGYFSIDPKGYNIPPRWYYADEGLTWCRDVSQEGRDALFAASQLARSI